MARSESNSDLYQAAKRFVDAALRSDDSLFTPGVSIWSIAGLDDLYNRYIAHGDSSADPYFVKLQRQLDGAAPATVQLAAELFFVHSLMHADTSGKAKRAMIGQILSWQPSLPHIPEELDKALDHGVASVGAAQAHRDYHIKYLLDFVRQWKQLAGEVRERALLEPWAFKEQLVAARRPKDRAGVQVEALLHLVFPDTFEDTVSLSDKQRLIAAFGDQVPASPATEDVDRRLLAIRECLSSELGPGFSFHTQAMKQKWKTSAGDNSSSDGSQVWLFQANPSLFDLAKFLSTAHIGDEDRWAVSHFGNELQVGDTVVLWQAGSKAGIYAVGEITGPVQARPADDLSVFPSGHAVAAKPVVPFRYTHILAVPISKEHLVKDPVLGTLQVLRSPQGTNFKVTPHQWQALRALIDGSVDSKATTPAADGGFEDLCAYLQRHDLFFTPELISAYLLALQTKRFVILTGISGTGKTQLARAVAKHFQPTIRVARPTQVPDTALVVTAQPYMRKYHRMVLPVSLAAGLSLPELAANERTTPITVAYPGGQQTILIGRYPGYTATFLLFRGSFRQWFDAHVELGKQFAVELIEVKDGATQELRISIPHTEVHTEKLNDWKVVAVRPDWTDNRGLLGYHNPLTNQYVTTPFLRLLLDAAAECAHAALENRAPHPFFAILDEMNIARVEHYFSDFLSCLESGDPLSLHDDPDLEVSVDDSATIVPRELVVPDNLFFTGTVNVDESTYMFSPKVLDRAFTLEFNHVDLHGFGALTRADQASSPRKLTLSSFSNRLIDWPRPNLGDAQTNKSEDWVAFGHLADGALRQVVWDIHAILEIEQRHFGYRVANEIARFVNLAHRQCDADPAMLWAALDIAILAKILPKLHGSQQELEGMLHRLLTYALGDPLGSDQARANQVASRWVIQDGWLVRKSPDEPDGQIPPTLPRTALKLWRMAERLRQQGFTSFIS